MAMMTFSLVREAQAKAEEAKQEAPDSGACPMPSKQPSSKPASTSDDTATMKTEAKPTSKK